jgi:hypothetical protein
MTKARYIAGVASLVLALAGLLAPGAASAATTAPQSATKPATATACVGNTYAKIVSGFGNVHGWLWYSVIGSGTCIGTVDEVINNSTPATKTASLHIGPYEYTSAPINMPAGSTQITWSVHQIFNLTDFKVCLGASSTTGYPCATIP